MKKVWAWAKRHWQVLTSAAGGLFAGLLIAVTAWHRLRKPTPVVPPPVVPPYDPTPVLGPIKEAEVALDAVDAATRAGAAADATRTKEGHDAIDDATSIGGVDVVLYGREHVGTGGAPPASKR
jgi:hypothetical protein